MKGKKTKLVVIAIFVAMLVVLIAVLFLRGGGPKDDEPTAELKNELQVQNELEMHLKENSASAGNPEKIGGEISKVLYEETQYQIVEINGSNCTISVTYPNAGALLSELSQDTAYNETSEELLAAMLARLEKGAVETITETVTTEMVDGIPEMNDALMNAFCGGLFAFFEEQIDENLQSRIDKQQRQQK